MAQTVEFNESPGIRRFGALILFVFVMLLLGVGVWRHQFGVITAAISLLFAAFAIGIFLAIVQSEVDWEDVLPAIAPWLLPVFLLAGFTGFLIVAVYRHQIDGLKAAMMLVLGGLTIWFACLFLLSIRYDGPPHFETNWGDIGGGSGGWRISASLTYLLATLVFVGSLGAAYEMHKPGASTEQNSGVAAKATASEVHPPSPSDSGTSVKGEVEKKSESDATKSEAIKNEANQKKEGTKKDGH